VPADQIRNLPPAYLIRDASGNFYGTITIGRNRDQYLANAKTYTPPEPSNGFYIENFHFVGCNVNGTGDNCVVSGTPVRHR
jgi:hypothetical protein